MKKFENDDPRSTGRDRAVAGRICATVGVVGGSLVVGVGGPSPAAADTFDVANTNVGGTGSLALALAQAAANPGSDTILFAPTLTGEISAGNIRIGSDLEIVGPGSTLLSLTNTTGDLIYIYNDADVTISGVTLSEAGQHAVRLKSAGDVTLENLAITNPGSKGISSFPFFGVGALTLSSVMIDGSGDDGIDVSRVTSVILTDVTLDNAGDPASGAEGIRFGYDLYTIESLTASNVTIDGADRLGLYVGPADSAVFSNLTIDDSGSAGGVQLVAGDVVIDGGLIVDSDGTGIRTSRNGLGVGGDLTIRNTTIWGGDGAALDLQYTTALIENTTIGGTTTSSALRISKDSNVTVSHSTISDNTVTTSAVRVSDNASLTIDHSIVSDNNGQPPFQLGTGMPTVTSTFGLVTASPAAAGLSVDATNIISDDPGLGSLADNDGQTPTLLPLAGSNAIDAGNPAITGAPATDQRGVVRIAGAAIDIGAVEIDVPGELSIGDVTVGEDAGSVDVEIVRSSGTLGPASATPSTSAGSADVGADFTSVNETVTWNASEGGSKTVTIPIVDDDIEEATESFSVLLFSVLGASIADGSATVTITDNDAPPATAPPTTAAPTTEPPPTEPPPTEPPTTEPPTTGAGAIASVAPRRYADTRETGETFDGTAQAGGKLGPAGELLVPIAGRGEVPSDAAGVVMNVTAVGAEGVGFVTVHPCVASRPLSSSLNYTPGVNLGNEIVSGLNADGNVCLFTSAAAHLTIDVVGYIAASSPLVSLTPARVLDTRANGMTIDDNGVGAGSTSPGSTTELVVAGRGGVAADAQAVIVNVTAIGPTDVGFVTVSPCVLPTPTASSLNYAPGVNRGNELIASVDSDGEICLFTSSSVQLTVDVVGYLPAGTNVDALAPARLLDTRAAGMTIDDEFVGNGKVAADSAIPVLVAGRAGVPASARAAIVNVTAIQADGVGFVTVDPCLDPRPLASSLNYIAGVNGGNEIVTLLDADGRICLYTSAAAHLTVDIVGYLT